MRSLEKGFGGKHEEISEIVSRLHCELCESKDLVMGKHRENNLKITWSTKYVSQCESCEKWSTCRNI